RVTGHGRWLFEFLVERCFILHVKNRLRFSTLEALNRKRFHGSRPRSLIADVCQEGHEAGPLDRGADRALKRGTIARALAAVELALRGAEFLQRGHVLVIDEGRPRAALLRAEAALAAAALTQFLADHWRTKPQEFQVSGRDGYMTGPRDCPRVPGQLKLLFQ